MSGQCKGEELVGVEGLRGHQVRTHPQPPEQAGGTHGDEDERGAPTSRRRAGGHHKATTTSGGRTTQPGRPGRTTKGTGGHQRLWGGLWDGRSGAPPLPLPEPLPCVA